MAERADVEDASARKIQTTAMAKHERDGVYRTLVEEENSSAALVQAPGPQAQRQDLSCLWVQGAMRGVEEREMVKTYYNASAAVLEAAVIQYLSTSGSI